MHNESSPPTAAHMSGTVIADHRCWQGIARGSAPPGCTTPVNKPAPNHRPNPKLALVSRVHTTGRSQSPGQTPKGAVGCRWCDTSPSMRLSDDPSSNCVSVSSSGCRNPTERSNAGRTAADCDPYPTQPIPCTNELDTANSHAVTG